MKILIHICCAPCLIYPYQFLKDESHQVRGYFYNPNIHPYQEYIRRLEEVKNYTRKVDLSVIYKDEYNLEEFLRGIVFREGERCRFCYYFRLSWAAKVARRGGFEAYTTTLLVSPYQKHELIKEIGEEVGRGLGVRFYYRDFRSGWKDSLAESRRLGLYHQQYCGCIYSERDRFQRKGRLKKL